MIASCKPSDQSGESAAADSTTQTASISETAFGNLPDGTTVSLYALRNTKGTEMLVTNYGGIITSLKTADRNGVIEDIVLGYDSLEGYIKAPSFLAHLSAAMETALQKQNLHLMERRILLPRTTVRTIFTEDLKDLTKYPGRLPPPLRLMVLS